MCVSPSEPLIGKVRQLPSFLDVSIYCVRHCSGAYFPLVRILIRGTKSRAGFLTRCKYRAAGSRIFMLRINGQGGGQFIYLSTSLVIVKDEKKFSLAQREQLRN